MASSEIGIRVIAIRNVENNTVYSFGAGVYEGDFTMPGTEEYPTGADYNVIARVVREGMTPEGLEKQMQFTESLLRWTLPGDEPITEEKITEELTKARQSYLDRCARPWEEQVLELWHLSRENPRIKLDNGGYVWGFECWWGPEEGARKKYPEDQFTWVEVTPQFNTAS